MNIFSTFPFLAADPFGLTDSALVLTDPENQLSFFSASLLIFVSNFLYYFLIFLKFYRVLCFSKITFDGLPMINPYIWPFSIFRILTKPYFKFWKKTFPNLQSGRGAFDVSLILALEVLSAIIYFLSQVRLFLLIFAADLIIES